MLNTKSIAWLEHVKTIVYALTLAMIIRGCVFEIFKIPSGSMKENLLVDDHVLVTKYSYGFGPFSAIVPLPIDKRIFFVKPHRGDIIVFRSPHDNDPKKYYIQRLIGLPGDKIQLIDGVVYVNSKPMKQTFISKITSKSQNGTLSILEKMTEETPEKTVYNVFYDPKYEADGFPNTTGIYTIPEHYYFFMGDNRNNSIDSRFPDSIGYVHELRLIGKTQYVLWNGSIISNIINLFKGDRYLVDVNKIK
jgi:signal peptidase I